MGHLAVSGDYLRRQWGRPAITPRDWGPRFGPGSLVPTDPRAYPATATLRAALLAAYEDLVAAAPGIPAALLDAPNSFEPARGPFPTGRDFAVYLMTAHLGYHLGQLGGWRVAAGLPARASSA